MHHVHIYVQSNTIVCEKPRLWINHKQTKVSSLRDILKLQFCFFFNSDIIHDARKVTRIYPPQFQWVSPHGGITSIFRSYRKQFQNAYPIQNFTWNNFVLRDRFNVDDDSRDIGVPN